MSLSTCPKSMTAGPCGGVTEVGACEIDDGLHCVFVEQPGPWRPFRARAGEPHPPAPTRGDGAFEAALRGGRFAVVGELNAPDSAAAGPFVSVARRLAEHVDVVSVTDHSGANVRMSGVSAVAHLLAAGVEAMPTFGCRDRNRIALQGDLLGAASWGAQAALIVTGNHVAVGDSPGARAVYDLDSRELLGVAARLRDRGEYDNGRRVEVAPRYLLGAAVHPFAPPLDHRPQQVFAKAAVGADFVISQHVFDLPRWRKFLAAVQALRTAAAPFLLAGVAVMPDGETARRVNAGLRGFTIPEAVLARLDGARDPRAEGIAIAAETVAELAASPGVSGCLLAPVTTRSNALGAADEQVDVVAAVRAAAGVPA